MKNGLVIVNYNSYNDVIKLIDNVYEYDIIDKIVIVDNNSTDNSYKELLRIVDSKIDVIKNDLNGGYGSGINVGAKYLIDLYKECNIIISNSDISINKEADIINLINNMSADTGIMAPVINTHGVLDKGWLIPSPMDDVLLNLLYIHRFLRPKLIGYKKEYYNQEIVDVEVVSGCFFVIKSKVLERCNYFDENLFLYYEENYIAKKIKELGLKTQLITTVEVNHNHSVTIDSNVSALNKYRILKKSQYYFQTKYNRAGIISRGLLLITSRIGYGILWLKNKTVKAK